jgi:hypothetical protein
LIITCRILNVHTPLLWIQLFISSARLLIMTDMISAYRIYSCPPTATEYYIYAYNCKHLYIFTLVLELKYCKDWDLYLRNLQVQILLVKFLCVPIPTAAQSKAYVCGRERAGIVGSNPTKDIDVCLLWVVTLSGRGLCDGPIPRPEEPYRLWCVSECDQVNINNLDTYCE